MRLRVFSDIWHGDRYWGFCVFDPAAPTNHQWLHTGHGRRSWTEALADGYEALWNTTSKDDG